jgi:hypothetical protein
MLTKTLLYHPPNESAENHQNFLQTAEQILQQLSTNMKLYQVI